MTIDSCVAFPRDSGAIVVFAPRTLDLMRVSADRNAWRKRPHAIAKGKRIRALLSDLGLGEAIHCVPLHWGSRRWREALRGAGRLGMDGRDGHLRG